MRVFIRNKLYRYITISDSLSVIGDSIFYLALIAYASQLPDSIFAISIISLSETFPPFLAFWTGHIVDKTPDKYKAGADIATNLLRGIIYIVVATILYFQSGMIVVILISILNFISDLIGTYSDNLRFPIVYSIIPEEDMEESLAFSNISYYLFSFLAKASGGIVLLLFNSNFELLSLANSLTFLIAAVLMMKVYPSLKLKMSTKIDDGDSENDSESGIFASIKTLLSNKRIMSVIVPVALVNALVGCILPLVYIFFNNHSSKNYEVLISLVGGASVLGIVVGNAVAPKIMKELSIHKILITNLTFIAIITLILGFETSNIVILLAIFLLFLIEGFVSPTFTMFIMQNQDYNSLGVSSGAVNTILASVVPFHMFIVLSMMNIFGEAIAYSLVVLLSLAYVVYTFKMEKIK